jgi:glucose-1-phosphate thymidylyltransferase
MLALFPAHAPNEMDMVEADARGIVRSLWLKPPRTELHDAWICAVWRPSFTEFLHEQIRFLQSSRPRGHAGAPELTVGHLLQAALESGLRMESVRFPEGRYLDIGTPDGWRRALLDGIADETPAASRHSECER